MKNLPNVLWRLICIISISLFAFGKTLAQIAENPHRGMYVDKFATYNSSEYLNDLSILGVDKEHDGIFEKEEELLEYASKNHFTSLTLYDLEGIFSDNAPKVWNQTDKRFEDLEEHLCRFIHRARTVYLIDEIIASVGSKASADNVPTFGRGFNSATLPFEFTEDEMALPSYTPNLQQIAGQYSDNDPMFLRSEIGKLVLRIAHFTSCGNQLQFNGFSTEYEFWNQDDIAADDLSATTFEIFLNDLNNIKDNFVGSHPGSPFTINIYYGKSATSYSKLTCPGCVAEFIDGNATGVTATDCGLAAAKPNYCGLSNWRRADRIFFEKYLSKSNQFTSHHEEIIFSGNQTLTNTVIHPLFSAQSRFNGATNDFLGDWILGGVGTNASDNDFGQLRNIFQAEKIHFLDWQSSQSGATNPNIEEPGAFQWYTSSYMLKSFKNTPLFYYDYQACETTPVLTFKYSGPREKNITYSFSITVTPGSGGPTFNQTTGNTSGETPDFTTSQGEFLPSYNISGIVPNSKVTASLTLNFDNGISVTYDKEIDLSSASISAIGKDGSSFTICEGEDIVLQASISNYSTPSYQWQFSVNNSTFTDIPSEISQLFHITKTGYYKCKIRCSNGTYYDSNSIQFIIKENPYILISASCSNPMTLSANNTGINGYAPGTYSYLWSNGETTPSITINSANHLSSYNVIVTNLSNNCIASNLIKIPDTFPSSSNITVTTSNPNCGSGSVNITVNNLTTDDVVKAIISDGISNFYYDNWTNTSNSKTITGLPVGNYHFTINSNSYACSASTDFSIGSDFDVSFVSTETHTNATCKGGANGSVQVNLSYTAGLIFEWSGITPATLTINANNVIATGFKPGTYFLKITDNSCHYRYVSFTINSNVSVSIIPVVVNTDCSGLNGKITFPPTSGYTFNWDYQSSTSNEIFPLSPGIYNCIVSFSGCTQTFTRFVDKNPPINIETKCAQDGSTHLMVYGGTPGSVSAYQITSNPAATWSAVVGNIGEYTSNLSTPRTYTSIQVIDSYTPACTTSVSNVVFPVSTTKANAGSDKDICGGVTTTTLAANSPVSGNGTWSIIRGNGGSFTSITNPATAFTGVTGESYVLKWSFDEGLSCTSYDFVNVAFHQSSNPTLASAGADQSACSTSVTLAGNTPAIGTGSWSVISGLGGSFTSSTDAATTFTGNSNTNYILRWTTTNGDCPTTDDVAINILNLPGTANVGPDITTACGVNSTLIDGNGPGTGQTGVWTRISGTPAGTFTNANLANTTYTGTLGVTYVLRWTRTRTSSGCTSFDELSVTLSENPTVTSTTPASRCGSGTVNLIAATSAGSLNWYTAATGGSPVGTGTSFTTPIITVSTPYYVEASNNGCSSARTLVDATINDIPLVTSTTPASRCGSGTVNLIAATSAGSLNWYTAATGGSPVGTGTSFTTPIITVSTPYYVEASNNGCSSARTLVDATINDIPSVTSTTPASRCGSGTVNLIAATSAGSLNWYTAATGGSPVGTGTSFTTPIITVSTPYYVEASNNGCSSARTLVDATINDIPLVTSTTPASRCGSGTVNLIAATSAGSLNWYTAATGGSPVGTGTSFTTPIITVSTPYYVEASNNGCSSARTLVDATINDIPSVTSTTPASRCGSGTVNLIAATSAGSLNWYTAATGGSPVGTGTSFTTPIITVSTPYYVEASNNGCSSARTLVDATINDIPSVTSTTPASRCGSGTVNLIAATSAGSLNWYTAATGGSPVGTGTSFTTPIITVSTPYYVEASNNGCSSARTLVDATINDIPLVTSTTPASRCGSGTVNLIAATSAGSLNWYTAATGGSPVGTGTSFTTPIITVSTPYYVEASNNGCSSARTLVDATINDIPSVTSTTPASRCGSGTVNLIAATSAGSLNWYTAATGGSPVGTGTSFTTPIITVSTPYYVEASNNGCSSARTLVDATINDIPSVTSTTPASRCGSGTVNLIAATSAGSLNWYTAATGGSPVGTGTSFTTPIITVSTPYYVEASNNGCSSARTLVDATINDIPSVTSTTPASRCGSGTVNLIAATSAGSLNWYTAATGGSPVGTGTSFTTPIITVSTPYYVEASNNGCSSARTLVDATINDIPSVTSTTPASRCGSGTVNLIAATSAGSLNWYTAATGGSPVGTGTSFTTPIITVSTPYYVEASNNGCSSARTLVDATINDIPSVTSTTPASRCGSGTVNLIAATSAGSLNWYTAATGGSPVGTGTSFTTPIITVSTPYYVEASNNGCSSARTLVDATINDIPLVTSTTPASRCGSGTVNLIAATSAGSLNWYTAATGGSPVGTGTSFTTPTLISNTFYYVGANNNNCNSTSRTTVLATIVAPPSNSAAGSDMTINCLGSLLMNANNPSIGTGTWYVIAGSGTFASPNSFQSDVTGLSQGTNTFAWTITNNPCMASTDNVDIVLNSTLPTTQIPPITGTYSLNVSFTLSNSMTISSSTVNIGKDVIIKVPSGKTLFIQNSILKACGNDMWGGIEIENGGALEISGSTIISDARFAVTAKEGSLLQINNGVSGTCTFDRCYQGILMPNYSTLKTYSINNVKFKCTSALISPYSGQKTNAGINAHNHVYIDLTNVEFEGLATGILSSGSSIAITGASKFLNSDNAIKAVGGNILIENAMLDNIYNSNTLGKTKAISMLFGNLVLRNSTLSKCETAVYFAKSTAEIRDNTFDDIDAAVYAQSPNYQDVIIESNTISNCSNTGIDLNSVGEANRIMVRFNNISIDNTPAGTSITSYGIKMSSISNLSNVKGNGSIAYNTIVLWTSGEAIGVSGKDYPFVTANTITLKNANSYMQKGVSVSEGRNGVINCNYVNSPGIISNVQNYGLFFSNTKNPIVTCNTSLGSNKGFYFTSPCGNVKLVRNEMSYNNVGLELTGSASIGEQPHYGNFFTGFGTSPDFPYAAFNYTTAFNNRILVYPDLAPVNFRPANNTISNNNTDLWFFGDYSAGERACNGMHYGPLVPLYNLLGDCSSPTPVAVDLEAARTLNLADTIAATDTFPSREFIAETNYELRRQLYETLRADPEKLQNNEIFEEFFDNFNSEPAGQFEEIMAELNEPGPVREQLANDIQQNVSLIEQYSIDILTNIESGNSLLNEALIQNVENLSATNEYFFQLIENEDLLKMQYLRNTNQSIDNQEIMDVNNSIVFEIYATTIEQDIYEFESDQLDKISEVAHQCPQKGGSAVYLARNLYSIAYPNEVYNDVAACISQGYYRLANKNKLSSNVYFHLSPNPTKDDIKASYYFSEDENPFLKIFNGLNQLVKTIPLNASNREQIIKLADLNGGIYFYNLVSNNSLIQEGKIAIIK